jgi:ribosomal protein L32/chaperonin cofactor prefoldin
MTHQQFLIITRGELADGYTAEQVRTNMLTLCKYPPETLVRVFAGRPFVLKSGLNRPTAYRYLAALQRTGLVCSILPQQEHRPNNRPSATQPPAVHVCPKCGETQNLGQSCVHCGIDFEKYRRLQERRREEEMLAGAVSAPGSAETPQRRASGWLWKLLPVALVAAAGVYLYPHVASGKPDANLLQAQSRVVEKLRSFGKSADDVQKELEGKRSELQAYQKFLVDFDKELEAMEKRNETAPICPKTGERLVTRLTKDPRPEVRDKIRVLEEEVRLLESKL